MNSRIIIKQGATLSLAGSVSLPAGDWSASASVSSGGGFYSSLEVTLTPPVSPQGSHHILMLKDASETEQWPVDNLNCDIRFECSDGTVVFSPTFSIHVSRGVTRG